MSNLNLCQSCGACCAHFRVSFYWGESTDAAGGIVPVEFTEKISPHLVCMKGSNNKLPRCIALRGDVGEQVSCSIYEQRPSTCREFNLDELDGLPNMRCLELRSGFSKICS